MRTVGARASPQNTAAGQHQQVTIFDQTQAGTKPLATMLVEAEKRTLRIKNKPATLPISTDLIAWLNCGWRRKQRLTTQ
jgi:hypothetical protein